MTTPALAVVEYKLRANHGAIARLILLFYGGGSLAFTLFSLWVLIVLGDTGDRSWWGGVEMLVAALFFLLAAGVTAMIVQARDMFVSVGADGVWIRQPFATKRFISYRDIHAFVEKGNDLTFVLEDASTVECHYAWRDYEETRALGPRINAALEAFKIPSTHRSEALVRKGRPVAEWMASAATQDEQRADYRSAGVSDEELWKIVEDATATPTERAGAALALRAKLDPEGKTRIRIAADACASPKLRAALSRVVEADDASLAAALEPLEEPRRRRTMKRP